MAEPRHLDDVEHVCTVPALRLPPDAETLERIVALHDAVGRRPLTDAEVLACLAPEGRA